MKIDFEKELENIRIVKIAEKETKAILEEQQKQEELKKKLQQSEYRTNFNKIINENIEGIKKLLGFDFEIKVVTNNGWDNIIITKTNDIKFIKKKFTQSNIKGKYTDNETLIKATEMQLSLFICNIYLNEVGDIND